MGSSHANLAPNTQSRLLGQCLIYLITFSDDMGDTHRLVENSHNLYIINDSILFFITIDTVTYHSKPQSLHLSCLVLSTHSLDPFLWGESDHPAFGPPTSISLHLASNSITPAGSVHKSRGDSVVHMWG